MSDRKKRLEEIKRKKLALQRELEATQGGARPPQPKEEKPIDPSTFSTPTSTTDSEPSSRGPTSQFSIEQRKKPIKSNITTEIQLKKLNALLKTFSFSETLMGIYPELADAFSQYELPKELQPEKKEDDPSSTNKKNKDAIEVTRGTRKFTTRKSSIDDEAIKKEQERNKYLISEEKAKEFLDLHADKITAFIKGKEKFLDYALFANDLFDLCETYYDEDEEDMDLSKRNLVTHLCDFYDEAMQGRVVTSLEWSLKHPDLFLTGYSQPSNAYEQSGLIQLWSLANKKAPELTISCQTEITNAIFHNLNPKVLLAGTFTGQVLLYDIKSKPVPIQKTPMDLGGAFQTHSYPIVSLTVIGTESNSNIISISSDGVLCQWSLANFSRPITRIHIKKRKDERTFAEKTANQIDDIGVLCSAYNPYFNNNILLGSDNNLIYSAAIDETEDKEYIMFSYKGNEGPIYSLDFHPSGTEQIQKHNDLFLSSSADWTTKLWSYSRPDSPLLTFDTSDDYVYACKWHPTNPSLFVTGEGTGKLDFWDLNKDKEVPVFRHNVKSLINKLSWSVDGRRLAVGDSQGKVTVFNAEKDVYTTKPEDFEKFDKVISDLFESTNPEKDHK